MAACDGSYVTRPGRSDGGIAIVYENAQDTLAEVLADGYFDGIGRFSLGPLRAYASTSRGRGCRIDITASDGRALDWLYLDGETLKVRGGAYRIVA